MRKYTGKIMRATVLSLVAFCLLFVATTAHRTMAVPTITSSIIDEWAAVAAGGTDKSTVFDLSDNYATAIHIQAFLDLDATTHEGTEFILQVSGMSSGDEDWSDLTRFAALVGTPNEQTLNGDHGGGDTTLLLADTGGNYELADIRGDNQWLAIEDSAAAAANELVRRTGFTTDTNVTVLDATTNAHLSASNMYDIAISRTVMYPVGCGYRGRIICNNGYDSDGTACTLVWKVGKTVATDMDE